MGKVTGNWLTGVHSGRACRHEDIYTRVNTKTGACYSAKLCNPNTNWTEKQRSQRNLFTLVTMAINSWINENKQSNSEEYLKVKRLFDRQTKYATLRGMMFAKGMYRIGEDNAITVDIEARTTMPKPGSSTETGGSTNQGGSGGSNDGGGSGGSNDGGGSGGGTSSGGDDGDGEVNM